MPPDDVDLDVVATWGSPGDERTYNGASIDADASLLPVTTVRLACFEGGCYAAVSAGAALEGAGLDGGPSDAVLAFDGDAFSTRLSSRAEDWDLVIDALAATEDGAAYAFGGRHSGSPAAPFGSELRIPSESGAVVMTASGDEVAGGMVFARASAAPSSSLRPVLGGLVLRGPAEVIGGARYRDELYGFDAVSPADPPDVLCESINSNNQFRWGALFAASLEAEAPALCGVLGTQPKPSEGGVRHEVLALARSSGLVLMAGHYLDSSPDGSFALVDPVVGMNEDPVKVLPETGAAYRPFVARVEPKADRVLDVQAVRALALPGMLEAAAMAADGSWLACGTVGEGAAGAVPPGCDGLAPGSLLVAYGRFDVEGCVDVAAEGRCRAAIVSPAGFVIAAVSGAAAAARSSIIEISAARQVTRRLDRDGIAVDSLGLLDGGVLLAGSFTGTLDQRDPLGGTADWDLFLARWLTP